jgi:serine protease
LATTDDEALPFQWHYPLIDLPAAWDTTTGKPGVIIAVVDTGILSDHPDLRGQLVSGYDFIEDPDSAGDGDGIDPSPEDTGIVSGPGSSNFHGTHVSGTVAATGNNGLGVAGVAYSARIMPLRALDSGGAGTSYDINQAVRFAAGLPNDSGTVPQQPAAIINLSLGGGRFSQDTQDLYNQVRAAGITVVASAGNEDSLVPAYPASYNNVISVSAVDAQGRITSYSNRGASIDVAAPGGDSGVDINGDGYPDGVLSTGGTGEGGNISFAYTFLSGTSMAAPHIAGVVALMKSVNPDLSPQDIDSLLASGDLTEDLGSAGRDDAYGHGLINAQRAVLAALEAGDKSPADKPRLSATASTLSFGTGSNTLDLELRNAGNGELELLELEVSDTWLQVSPVTIDEDGLGLYQVAIDRRDLASGVYAGDIVARSSVNTLSIRVIMAVAGEGITADVGKLYILLYEPASDEAIAQFATSARDGEYRFKFENIPAGQYEIAAGPDADNDQFICDPGEACGAWLTVDQPILIDLDSDIDTIEFPIQYQVALPNLASGIQGSAPARRERFRGAVPVAKGGKHVDH